MIAQLSDISHAAEPTVFHNLLRALDNRGRLLRVYTQNIDAIEQKSGLSFGVPDFDSKRSKSKLRGKARIADMGSMIPGLIQPTIQLTPNRLPSPPVDTPRCIPLHGTLQSMHCQACNHAFPLSKYLSLLASGHPPPCPECTNLELARKLIGKRPRGIGRLRPSVVLYNEEHKDGEGVGEVVQRDLMGSKGRSGADLLLVVGTSLKVPGTKRMVREFSKAVKARCIPSKMETGSTSYALRSSTSGGLTTPAASPRRTPAADEDTQLPKSIYLNLDFPVPTREWEGVFDVWIQGDAQLFAETLQAEIDKEARTKEMASERKRRKDEEAAVSSAQDELPDLGRVRERKATVDLGRKNAKLLSKRKLGHESKLHHYQSRPPSSKKRKLASGLLTPPHTPPTSTRLASHKRLQTREGSLKSPIVAKLTIRLPPLSSQSTDDDAEMSAPPLHGRQGRITPSMSESPCRIYSTPTPAYETCTKAGGRIKQPRKTRQRSHFSGPHICLSSLRTYHQESQMCSSSAQCRDGLQDGELDIGRSVPRSSPALMDITVG